MRINSISQANYNNSQTTFQGKVDKSVTNSLKNFYEQYRREKIIEVINNNKLINFDNIKEYKSDVKDVTKRLNEFMQKCHKDSVLKFDVGKRGALRNQPRTPASLYIENKVLPKGYISEISSSNEFTKYKPYEGDAQKELKALLGIINGFLENNTPQKCNRMLLENALQTTAKKSATSATQKSKRTIKSNLKRIENYKNQIEYSPTKFEKQKNLIIENLKTDKKTS